VEARPVVTGGGGGGEAHDGGRLVGCGGGRALASARGEGAAAPPVSTRLRLSLGVRDEIWSRQFGI
jgi:hypothetical protein